MKLITLDNFLGDYFDRNFKSLVKPNIKYLFEGFVEVKEPSELLQTLYSNNKLAYLIIEDYFGPTLRSEGELKEFVKKNIEFATGFLPKRFKEKHKYMSLDKKEGYLEQMTLEEIKDYVEVTETATLENTEMFLINTPTFENPIKITIKGVEDNLLYEKVFATKTDALTYAQSIKDLDEKLREDFRFIKR